MADATRERILAVIEPALVQAGYDLEELKVSQAGRRSLVRVLVDRDAGVDLDAIAAVSRVLSKALDQAEADEGPFATNSYTLEVSSPGVDRPLTLPRHWRRNVNRLVSVRLDGATVTARVLAAADDDVELDVSGQRRRVAYGELGPGRVQLEFSRSGDKKRQE